MSKLPARLVSPLHTIEPLGGGDISQYLVLQYKYIEYIVNFSLQSWRPYRTPFIWEDLQSIPTGAYMFTSA